MTFFLDKLENEFFSKDINLQGKIVVFSESKVTTDYLVKRLKNDGFKKVLSIDGSNRVKLKESYKVNLIKIMREFKQTIIIF